MLQESRRRLPVQKHPYSNSPYRTLESNSGYAASTILLLPSPLEYPPIGCFFGSLRFWFLQSGHSRQTASGRDEPWSTAPGGGFSPKLSAVNDKVVLSSSGDFLAFITYMRYS